MDIGRYDLNLLRIFALVYEQRSVTATAELMKISQPSVSFALGKLRKMFADPLFQRGATGLEPTPLATGIFPEIQQALMALDDAVSGLRTFDPSTANRQLTLMMTDLGLMALFPYIVQAVHQEAPNISISVQPLDASKLRDRLMRNEVDAAIGIPIFDEADLVRDHLMDMPYVGICAKDHPRISDSPTLREFARESQVAVANHLGHEHVRNRLGELGIDEQISVTLPHFAVLAQTLAVTEHVSAVPRALADIFGFHPNIRQFKLPFNIEPGHVALYTYGRKVPSPFITWLRGVVQTSLEAYPYPKYVKG